MSVNTILEESLSELTQANTEFYELYPGQSELRQPLHTVYGGAQLFKPDTIQKMGKLALSSLELYTPDFSSFANALTLPGYETLPVDSHQIEQLTAELQMFSSVVRKLNNTTWLLYAIYQRVVSKLRQEPIEDYRIDFEDGLGVRSEEEEALITQSAARACAQAILHKHAPIYLGIRIKPLSQEFSTRSLNTLEQFIAELVTALAGHPFPSPFLVALPKITNTQQVVVLTQALETLEHRFQLPPQTLKIELLVETPQVLMNSQGMCQIPRLLEAAGQRCQSVHLGAYDLLSLLGVSATDQSLDHPYCDEARYAIRLATAGKPIWVSDGAIHHIPIGIHRDQLEYPSLTQQQVIENRQAVYKAWKIGFDHIQRAMKFGFYQGWDLHPAQLPMRYAACYLFFLQQLEPCTQRLRGFIQGDATTHMTQGSQFDDAASAQGLLNFFIKGHACGALTQDEVEATGLSLEEMKLRSFAKIVAAKHADGPVS